MPIGPVSARTTKEHPKDTVMPKRKEKTDFPNYSPQPRKNYKRPVTGDESIRVGDDDDSSPDTMIRNPAHIHPCRLALGFWMMTGAEQ